MPRHRDPRSVLDRGDGLISEIDGNARGDRRTSDGRDERNDDEDDLRREKISLAVPSRLLADDFLFLIFLIYSRATAPGRVKAATQLRPLTYSWETAGRHRRSRP